MGSVIIGYGDHLHRKFVTTSIIISKLMAASIVTAIHVCSTFDEYILTRRYFNSTDLLHTLLAYICPQHTKNRVYAQT